MNQPTASLRTLYVNVGGKQATIASTIDPYSYDILCFAETHRYEGDAHYVTIPGFTSYACNRPAGKGGGIAVLLNNSSVLVGEGTSIKVTSNPYTGIVWVEVGTLRLLIAVCYFSPIGSSLYAEGVIHPDPLQSLFDGIELGQGQDLRCMVIGDLNIRIGGRCHDVPEYIGAAEFGPPVLQQVQQEPQEWQHQEDFLLLRQHQQHRNRNPIPQNQKLLTMQ